MLGRSSRRCLIASAMVVVAVGLASYLTPRTVMASDVDVDRLIPKSFGSWQLVPGVTLVDQAPDSLASTIYSQSVGRAYRDAAGRMVMLLVAYGPNQSEGLQMHRPEICYTADGFAITKVDRTSMSYRTRATPLPVTRVRAEREGRTELISYWMRVGNDVTQSALQQNLTRMKYGLQGYIPDGALVRVSTIAQGPEGYAVEERFISDLLDSVPPADRDFLIGSGA